MKIAIYTPEGKLLGLVDSAQHILVVACSDEEKERLIDAGDDALVIYPRKMAWEDVEKVVKKGDSA